MSQSPIVYEATVYSRDVTYKNFKGEVNTTRLHFAMDPLQLLHLISTFEVKKLRSGNPAKAGVDEITEEQQLKFTRDLACKAAGFPSEDGETWEPFEGFEDTLVGKAFLTKLTSSDGDRKEFAEQVILAPFRAFVTFAEADPTNTPSDVQQFRVMLTRMENIFKVPAEQELTLGERKAKLAAEMAALEAKEQHPSDALTEELQGKSGL